METKDNKKKFDLNKIVLVLIGIAFLIFVATNNSNFTSTYSSAGDVSEKPAQKKTKMNNDTPEGAAMMFIKACIEEDEKAMDKVNRSDAFNYPTNHVLDMAARRQMATFSLSDFSFSVVDEKKVRDPENVRIIMVKGPEGAKADWKLQLVRMNGKWYFEELAY